MRRLSQWGKRLTPNRVPQKKEKKNKTFCKQIIIEHINRKLKNFNILGHRYRNRCRRYGLRCNLLAAIYTPLLSLWEIRTNFRHYSPRSLTKKSGFHAPLSESDRRGIQRKAL